MIVILLTVNALQNPMMKTRLLYSMTVNFAQKYPLTLQTSDHIYSCNRLYWRGHKCFSKSNECPHLESEVGREGGRTRWGNIASGLGRWPSRPSLVYPRCWQFYHTLWTSTLRCRNLRFHTFQTNYWSFLFEHAMEVRTILEKSLNRNTFYCQLCVKLLYTQPYSNKNEYLPYNIN